MAAPLWGWPMRLRALAAASPCLSPVSPCLSPACRRSGTGLMVSEISFGTMTFSDVDKAATGSGRGDSGEAAYAMLEACYKVRTATTAFYLSLIRAG